jgi:hypothetical protein
MNFDNTVNDIPSIPEEPSSGVTPNTPQSESPDQTPQVSPYETPQSSPEQTAQDSPEQLPQELNLKNAESSDLFHPCQYCGTSCRGKQCKKCHFKMVASKQGTCIDCSELFFATRIDGTKRRRCITCQETYNKRHIAKCPDCDKDYHAFLEDGRTFSKCYSCYQLGLTPCEKCDRRICNNLPLCKDCYNEQKASYGKPKLLSYSPTSSASVEYSFKRMHKDCKTEGCTNTTSFSYCKSCYEKNRTF